jgi:hypothetical protein
MAMALHEAGARCRKSYRPAARRHLAAMARRASRLPRCRREPQPRRCHTGEIDKDLLQLDRRELSQRLFPPPNA